MKDNNRRIGKVETKKTEEKLSAKQIQQRQIEIAKDLFMIWDGDGEGSLSQDEIMKAFIQIGLSQDHLFAQKIMQNIKPKQVKKESLDEEEESEDIKLKDFIKIFRNDEISDNLTKRINEEIVLNRKIKKMKEEEKVKEEVTKPIKELTDEMTSQIEELNVTFTTERQRR